MNLPKIDLASLPGIDAVTGLFGSMTATTPTVDDRIVVLMVYIYEVLPPPPTFF
ncbi:hypothetical protein [Qipengyuania marisflavi]|uniref:hypothetical protein n=1 Tax=Qipengyuania marisflavi TaxID=2486356 RepID=UPI001486B1F2|nr:hypothetical protein [Qipengyuania marisflavi]